MWKAPSSRRSPGNHHWRLFERRVVDIERALTLGQVEVDLRGCRIAVAAEMACRAAPIRISP